MKKMISVQTAPSLPKLGTWMFVSATMLTFSGAAHSATFIWSGGAGAIDSINYDTGTSPTNGVADVVNISNGGQASNANNFSLEGLDTYNLSTGGYIRNIRSGNKTLVGNGATINIGSGGTVGGGNRFSSSTANLTGDGVLLMGNGNETLLPQLGGTTVNLDPAWTGEVYFTAQPLLDDLSEFDTWMDTNGANKFFVSGVALTAADRGTKFVVDVVTSGSGLEPTFATNDAGLSMTLISIPEPSSLALIGLGCLSFTLRRRK